MFAAGIRVKRAEDHFVGKAILSFFFLGLLAVSNFADAATYNLKLIVHNQRSSSGTRSTLVWKECTPSTNLAPCIASPTPQWNIDNNVVGSDAVWTWTPASGLDGTLAETGQYWVTSYINSNPRGTPVISDRVVDLVVDTQARTTTFASYDCIEGTFLAGVNASGCRNVNLGFNTILDSISEWNVGGDPYCVTLEIVDDDFSLLDGNNVPIYKPGTPNPRGGHAVNPGDPGLAPGCTKTSGGFDIWSMIDPAVATAPMIPTNPLTNQPYDHYDLLFISNGVDVIGCTLPVDIDCQGANWITFAYAPTASDDPVDVPQGVATPVDVLANDTYLTPNTGARTISFAAPITLTIETQPIKGTAQVTGSTITYTSNPTATGSDRIVYKVVDANGDSDTATVDIHMDVPGASDDTAVVLINGPATDINVGANDTGLTDPVTVTIETPPARGTATAGPVGPRADATVSFTPDTVPYNAASYDVEFSYRIADGTGFSSTAFVTVHVRKPLEATRTITTQGHDPLGRTATFTPFGSDVTILTQGTRGTVTQSGNLLTYTITDPTFFTGSDTFTYLVTVAGEEVFGLVTVTVPDALAAPRMEDGVIRMDQDTSGTILLGIVPGNGTLSQHNVTISTPAVSGDCTLSGVGTQVISITYTPDPGFTGTDECVVTATDADLDSGQATMRMTVLTATSGGSASLPGGGGSVDLWSLSLLAGAWSLRRRLRGRGNG